MNEINFHHLSNHLSLPSTIIYYMPITIIITCQSIRRTPPTPTLLKTKPQGPTSTEHGFQQSVPVWRPFSGTQPADPASAARGHNLNGTSENMTMLRLRYLMDVGISKKVPFESSLGCQWCQLCLHHLHLSPQLQLQLQPQLKALKAHQQAQQHHHALDHAPRVHWHWKNPLFAGQKFLSYWCSWHSQYKRCFTLVLDIHFLLDLWDVWSLRIWGYAIDMHKK